MNKWVLIACSLTVMSSCKTPALTGNARQQPLPGSYGQKADSSNAATIPWRQFFADTVLTALIDTALQNNQELQITLQEIAMRRNEIQAREGEYLPFVSAGLAAGIEKSGRFTRNGAVDESLEIKPGKAFPAPLPDLMLGATVSWELDVWKKLRNARKAAVMRYLSSVEGKNFMVTRLVAEIAASYYELMALDNLLDIIQQNISIQANALDVIRQEKDAAKVSQLAVNRFEAQLLNTRNLRYDIQQRITETENRIHFLTGRYPQPLRRNKNLFNTPLPDSIAAGLPAQLLQNRPDIRQAELEIAASKLDLQSAKAAFYPSFRLTAGIGVQAYNPAYLVKPESVLYNLAGDMMAPLINRKAIKAGYLNANARQLQAMYQYGQTLLNACIEVQNELSKIQNYTQSYTTKQQQVEILSNSVSISNSLYRSARADYVEVLLTQREALESRIDLTEIRLKQLLAKVNVYRALGGGWH